MDMDKQKVLVKLIWDLQSFLSVLDSENLSYIAQAQKKSVSELLSKLQSPDSTVEDAEYMVMSCPSSSPSNEPADSPGTEAVRSSELASDEETRTAPPIPPAGLRSHDDDDDDTYEEAEPYVSASITERAESDSSHYESYGEDNDEGVELVKDRAHYIQWSASQPCLRPAPEPSRLCSYLWRRKWLGQWSKQLFIVRGNDLLCYKCARDLLPQLELNLRGCQILYKWKNSKKIQHQLKVLPPHCEGIVLGYSSYQQADEWRRVMEELSAAAEEDSRSVSSLNQSERRRSRQSEEDTPPAVCSLSTDRGFLNVLMNCQWQSLLCRVEKGLLNMFAEEEPGGGPGENCSPQYTVQLRGCEVMGGPDTARSLRITLNMLGEQLAVLEVGSSEERQCWMKLLRDAAATHGNHGNDLSGLRTRRFPTCNTYMDDPFDLNTGGPSQPLYSNSSMLEHMLDGSQDSIRCSSVSSRDSVTYSNTVLSSYNRKSSESQRVVQKLELTGRRTVQLRAGSETNLATAGRQNKRTFRQSLAVCTERAQTGFLNPLLRRTASAKNSLRRAPSTLFIEHGKVFQRRKEWETKAAA